MPLLNLKTSSDQLFRLLFHLIFWAMWIGWPILLSADNPKFRQFMIAMLPVSLTHIPLFLINTEWLIPRILRRRGVGPYLLSLLGLIVAFTLLQVQMKQWVLPPEMLHHRSGWYMTLVSVISIAAISTAYGFIMYLVDQEKARREERQERLQSELAFLRSQISPHFIFNVLNSIVYLIRSKSDLAEPVTIQLGELMRYTLYEAGSTQVPIEREIRYLENYVELQRIRFGEDVDIRLQSDCPGGATRLIEPMLLIPFVENAFKHGVGLIIDPIIDISIRCSEDDVYFTVRNHIAPEPVESKDPSSGIGLRNVSRRLELLYPDAHRLEVRKEEEWFVVELWVHLKVGHSAVSSRQWAIGSGH